MSFHSSPSPDFFKHYDSCCKSSSQYLLYRSVSPKSLGCAGSVAPHLSCPMLARFRRCKPSRQLVLGVGGRLAHFLTCRHPFLPGQSSGFAQGAPWPSQALESESAPLPAPWKEHLHCRALRGASSAPTPVLAADPSRWAANGNRTKEFLHLRKSRKDPGSSKSSECG